MRSCSTAELLALWEAGQGRSLVERAVLILAASRHEASVDASSSLSIGERDSLLLSLREQVFGPTLASTSSCPGCGEHLEQTFAVDAVRAQPTAMGRPDLSVTIDGETVRFRLPTSDDLLALTRMDDVREARVYLVKRCLLSSSAIEPSERLISAVADRMAQADPGGDIQLVLICPGCSTRWIESFDIVSFFWTELTAWATRLLDDVHQLASAYGWHEADILAMSGFRREQYIGRLA
jgi:hypothetical protein